MKRQTHTSRKSSARRAAERTIALVPLLTILLFSFLIYSCENAVDNSHPRATYTIDSDSIPYDGNSSIRIDDSVFVDYSKTWMVIVQYEYKSTNPVSIEYWARNKNGGPDVYKHSSNLDASNMFLPVCDTIYPQNNCTSNIYSMTYTLQSPSFAGSSTVIRSFNLYRYQ